jgi:hypothetical protein
VTDRLTQGQQLNVNDQLVSNNGKVRLVMQADGNLVEYRNDTGYWVWSTWTGGRPVSRAIMQDDGNFVLYDGNNVPYWSTGTMHHPGAYIVLQDDGNLVVYGPDNKPLWAHYII